MGAAASGGGGGKSNDVRAGGAFVEIYAKDSGLNKALRGMGVKVKAFAEGLKSIGSGLTFVGGSALAPITALLKSGTDRAEGIDQMARKLGFTINQMQRLQYAAEVTGDSLDDVMNNPGRYAGVMAETPMLDTQTIKDAVEVNREWRKTWIDLQNATLPLLTSLKPILASIREFVSEHKDLIPIIAKAAVLVVGLGAGFYVVGTAIAAVTTAAATLWTAIGIILNPTTWVGIGIAAAAFVGLGASFAVVAAFWGGIAYEILPALLRAWELVAESFGPGIARLGEDASVAWKGIKSAFADNDFSRLFEIMWTGAKLVFFEGMQGIEASTDKLMVNIGNSIAKGLKLASMSFVDFFADTAAKMAEWIRDLEIGLHGFGLSAKKAAISALPGGVIADNLESQAVQAKQKQDGESLVAFNRRMAEIEAQRNKLKEGAENFIGDTTEATLDAALRKIDEETQATYKPILDQLRAELSRLSEANPNANGNRPRSVDALGPQIQATRGAFRLADDARQQFSEGTLADKTYRATADAARTLVKIDENTKALADELKKQRTLT
ncbi:hypothetical protein [Zavarzinella formosa]|uniref:hypothetical protein n=1 Tax=Zavarzinella formosa TaxID=360055 RepID=UPI00031DECF2|nr:hypothetical protein [Zavarzinella formosa]